MCNSLEKYIIPAHRTKKITYAVRDVQLVADEAKRTGKEILSLNIGDPNQFDFVVPAHLVEAVYKAMTLGYNGYGNSLGLPQALEAIRREAHRKGIESVQDVFTGHGASEAIELALSALADAGDNVILPCPGYPLYAALNAKLNIESRFYRLNEEDQWHPDIDDIASKIDEHTKIIVLINPNNPTGSMYSRNMLLQILELARRHRLVIFSDEIYDKIILEEHEQHIATASLAQDIPVVTFGGLSKAYLAPGWRIGWAIISGPADMVREYIDAIHRMLRARLCVNLPMQYAIQPALDGDHSHVREMNQKLRVRRDITYQRLNQIPGLSCVKPTGAFYAFPKIESKMEDKLFVENLIRQTGVVTVHGSGFGDLAAAKGHFRIVFLPDENILAKAYNHIETFAKQFLK